MLISSAGSYSKQSTIRITGALISPEIILMTKKNSAFFTQGIVACN
jgi:hypothetical protein